MKREAQELRDAVPTRNLSWTFGLVLCHYERMPRSSGSKNLSICHKDAHVTTASITQNLALMSFPTSIKGVVLVYTDRSRYKPCYGSGLWPAPILPACFCPITLRHSHVSYSHSPVSRCHRDRSDLRLVGEVWTEREVTLEGEVTVL